MRSLLIFALLALALCGNPLDIVTGFTTQLALSDAQTQDVNVCVGAVFGQLNGVGPLYRDYISGNLESLIEDAATWFEHLEPAIQAACEPVLNDLDTYVVTFGNGESSEYNMEVNSAYVAQHVAVLIQNVAQLNYTGIGAAVGYIFQVAVGSVDLPSLLPKQLTDEEYQALIQNAQTLESDNDALGELLQGYVSELGLDNSVDVASLVQLISDLKTVVVSAEALDKNFNSGEGTWDSDITAIEKFANSTLEAVRANQKGLESIVEIDAPVFEALVNNPLAFIGNTIFNILLNAPQSAQLEGQLQQDLAAGNFTAVGVDEAQVVKASFGQVYSN